MLQKKLNLKTILILIIAFAFKIYPTNNNNDEPLWASVQRADQPTTSTKKNIEKEAILLFLKTSNPSQEFFKTFIEAWPNREDNGFERNILMDSLPKTTGGSVDFESAYCKLIPKYITSYSLSEGRKSLDSTFPEVVEPNISENNEPKVSSQKITSDLLGSVEKYQEQYKKEQAKLIEQKLLELKEKQNIFNEKLNSLFGANPDDKKIDNSFSKNILDYILVQSKLLAEIETAGIHYKEIENGNKLIAGEVSRLVEEKTQNNRGNLFKNYNSFLAEKITSGTTSSPLLAILKIKKEALIFDNTRDEAKQLNTFIERLTPSIFKKNETIEQARAEAISFVTKIPIENIGDDATLKQTKQPNISPTPKSTKKTRPQFKYFTDQDKSAILKSYKSQDEKLQKKGDEGKPDLSKLRESATFPNFEELSQVREIAPEELSTNENIEKDKQEQIKKLEIKIEELKKEKEQFNEDINRLFGGSIYETPDDLYSLNERAQLYSKEILKSFEKQAKLLAEISITNANLDSLDSGKNINSETMKLLTNQETERHLKNLLQYYEQVLTPLSKAGQSPEKVLTILSIQLKQQELLPRSQEATQKQLDLKKKVSQLKNTLISKKQSRIDAAKIIAESLNYQTTPDNPKAKKVKASGDDQDEEDEKETPTEDAPKPKTKEERISELEESLKKVIENEGSTAFLQGKGHILLDSDGSIIVDESNEKIIISNNEMKELKDKKAKIPQKAVDKSGKQKRFKESDELIIKPRNSDSTEKKITLDNRFEKIDQKPTKMISDFNHPTARR